MTFFFRVQTTPGSHGGPARATAPVVESGIYMPRNTPNPTGCPHPLTSNVRSGYSIFGGATNATYRNRIFQPRP